MKSESGFSLAMASQPFQNVIPLHNFTNEVPSLSWKMSLQFLNVIPSYNLQMKYFPDLESKV